MPAKWPWFERTFNFDFPVTKAPDIIERLRGTPARAEELIHDTTEETLRRRDGQTWSILQNIGHLAVLEPLWMGRIDDILASAEVMREADLTNKATHAADYNERPPTEVTASFRNLRRQLVQRLEALSETEFAMTSIHPRTKIPMRVLDLCAFVAEHDDYHLARISKLKRTSAR